MKKVLTVLAIMAIAMGMVFATEGSISSSGANLEALDFDQSAELNVTFTPTTEMATFFEVGFTEAPVEKTADGGVPAVTPSTTLELAFRENATMGEDASGTTYVYWIVKGFKANVSIMAGDHMTNTDSVGTSIKWRATVGEDGNSTNSGETDSVDVATNIEGVTGGSTAVVVVGSQPITISTVNLASTEFTANKTYSSKLTLQIESVQ